MMTEHEHSAAYHGSLPTSNLHPASTRSSSVTIVPGTSTPAPSISSRQGIPSRLSIDSTHLPPR